MQEHYYANEVLYCKFYSESTLRSSSSTREGTKGLPCHRSQIETYDFDGLAVCVYMRNRFLGPVRSFATPAHISPRLPRNRIAASDSEWAGESFPPMESVRWLYSIAGPICIETAMRRGVSGPHMSKLLCFFIYLATRNVDPRLGNADSIDALARELGPSDRPSAKKEQDW